jgi:hypothetical protein
MNKKQFNNIKNLIFSGIFLIMLTIVLIELPFNFLFFLNMGFFIYFAFKFIKGFKKNV